MPINFKVNVDLSGVASGLNERFGIGSDAQYEWSRIVFDGSRKYMPKVTGNFENLSYMQSKSLFEMGELVYPGPMGRFLWHGLVYIDPDTGSAWARRGVTKIPIGKNLKFNQGQNPLAGARWTERARNDNMEVWLSDFQSMIDSGIV